MTDLDLYKETILEEAAHPQCFGLLDNADATARYGNASCGDMFTVSVKFANDRSTVAEIGWEGSGCAISTAAMSLVAQHAKKLPVPQILTLTARDVADWLAIETVSPGRVSCVSAGLKALQRAVS